VSIRVTVSTIVAVIVAAAVSYGALAGTSGVRPFATGSQQIQSGPGVYAQTTDEYSSSWNWAQVSASYDYYWYIFTSGGSLVASGHKPTGGGGSWSGGANVYYFKEYNNEPGGSGHINVINASVCC
jgi:hypothetical protein